MTSCDVSGRKKEVVKMALLNGEKGLDAFSRWNSLKNEALRATRIDDRMRTRCSLFINFHIKGINHPLGGPGSSMPNILKY